MYQQTQIRSKTVKLLVEPLQSVGPRDQVHALQHPVTPLLKAVAFIPHHHKLKTKVVVPHHHQLNPVFFGTSLCVLAGKFSSPQDPHKILEWANIRLRQGHEGFLNNKLDQLCMLGRGEY